ncbi:MAG TPA: LytR C-terminal domain-containing protein [Bacteroidota bacterium]|nr:LytR C-terminal domain-containing protein [Bacteroidota bacterium]
MSSLQTPEGNSPRRIDVSSSTPRRRTVLLGGLLAAGMLVVTLRLLFVGTASEPQIVQNGRVRAIQLDVLNGTQETKLAQRVTDYLRIRGFDVVEIGNFRSTAVESTLVIDRIGDPEAARQVAEALGVREENVRRQIDKNLFLDVSVIIGNDYKTLKAFR